MEQKAKHIDFLQVVLMILGASWVDNGSKQRARKACQHRACNFWIMNGNKMKEYAEKNETVILNMLFGDFILGASWVGNGSKQRARKAAPAWSIVFGTRMEAK